MQNPSIIPFDRNSPMEPWPDFSDQEIVSGSRKHNGVNLFEDKPRGLTAGVWEQEANESAWMNYPVNEFMLVLEGEVVIVEEDRSVSIKAGESFIIPKGLRCRWTQPAYVRKFFVIQDDPECPPVAGPLRTIKIDPKVALEPSTPPPPEMLVSGNPVQNNHLSYTDATGQLTIGVWDTTAYTRKLIPFPRHELMHILEGTVTMDNGAGTVQTFNAGDTFFVPMGTLNSWRSGDYLRKIYVIFQPKG